MKLVSGGLCDTGLKRQINQDAIGIFSGQDEGLFVVADGMGGHSEGERASRDVVEACRKWWEEHQPASQAGLEFRQVVEELKGVLAQAGKKIWEETKEDEICGAAAVLLWIHQKSYALLWCGDSRCYLAEPRFFGAKVTQMTIDDVWENQPDTRLNYGKDELLTHPNRGKLVRAVGANEEAVCTVQTGVLGEKFLFALCSDGIYKYMKQDQFRGFLKSALKAGDLEDILLKMKISVYGSQAPDNLSCILVKAQG